MERKSDRGAPAYRLSGKMVGQAIRLNRSRGVTGDRQNGGGRVVWNKRRIRGRSRFAPSQRREAGDADKSQIALHVGNRSKGCA